MEKVRNSIKSLSEFAIIVIIAVIVFKFAIIPVRIDGSSMENTLEDDNIALINAIGVDKDMIQRFDIVVVYSDDLDEKIIKRIIGLPGETIEYRNDILYVNGEEIEESFLSKGFVEQSKKQNGVTVFTEDFTYTIPEDGYFVMGDNRLHSTDSRELGSFTIEDIQGVNGIVIYPFDAIQWLY